GLAARCEPAEQAAEAWRMDLPTHLVDELRPLARPAETLEAGRRTAAHEDAHVVVEAEDVEAAAQSRHLLVGTAWRADPTGGDAVQVPAVQEVVLLLRFGPILGAVRVERLEPHHVEHGSDPYRARQDGAECPVHRAVRQERVPRDAERTADVADPRRMDAHHVGEDRRHHRLVDRPPDRDPVAERAARPRRRRRGCGRDPAPRPTTGCSCSCPPPGAPRWRRPRESPTETWPPSARVPSRIARAFKSVRTAADIRPGPSAARVNTLTRAAAGTATTCSPSSAS